MGWVHNASPEVEAASQYRLILGVCLSLTILMVCTVSLRLFLRARASRWAAADYVMVVSMAFSVIYSALCISQSRYGLGLPLKQRPAANYSTYTKINYAGRPFYQIGIAGFKASLCLSYLRLISGTSKRLYRIVIWIVIAASTLGHIAGALSLLFNCTPIRRSWNAHVPGTCLPVGGLFYGLAIYTIITDVTIIVLPIPLLLSLNIKTAQKAGVVCLFLLGLFTTVCSIMRLTQIQRVAFGDGNSTMLVLWGTIEFNVGNIVTCIPYLAPLLKGFVRGLGPTSDRSKNYYYDSQGKGYLMGNWSKDRHSHMQSTASGRPQLKRTPSEELILASQEPDHGGISGLVLAQYLQRHDVAFKIFDRDSAIDARSGGWGLTLHWSLPALRELLPEHLVERFPETFVNKEASARGDVGRFQFFDLKSGDALYNIPAAERIRVSRVRLRQLLSTGVDVQWNKNLRNIESTADEITAHFEDGTSHTGRLLVACDGSRSRVREILYPNVQMNHLPVQLLGASTLYSAEEMGGVESIDPFIFQGSHPESNVFLFFSFLDTPNNFENSSKDRYHCQIIISWADSKGIPVPDTNAERLALMKKLTDNWSEPFRSLVQKLPHDVEVRSIRVEDWMFSLGRAHAHPRAVLMGDSAHTMTMFRGEGANNAIVDVLDLVTRVDMRQPSSFDSKALLSSLAAYENDVFARAEPSFLNSRQACLDAHDFSKIEGSPLVGLRDLKKSD
ncbi:hypothetical protein CBS147332_1493 [Penicillium roqueforti]|nr:hypothetical protein CBS147332_1493 [Penicillium roqueforti]KAI3123054.1 hypothetical protein CBS147331_1504 [Penicillium roqueforti]